MLLATLLIAALSLKGIAAQYYESEPEYYSLEESPSYETSTTSRTSLRRTRSSSTFTTSRASTATGSTPGSVSATASSRSTSAGSISVSASRSVPSISASSVSSTASLSRSVSRSSAVSSHRSSSPIPSGSVSYIHIPGCPPIASTTKTITQTVTGFLGTVTSTISIFGPNATFYDYTTTTSYSYTTVTSYTATVTLDSTATVSTAETIITQPTAPGFTPVSCHSLYHIPVVTAYSTSTYPETWTSGVYTSDPANGFTITEGGYVYNATTTITYTAAAQSTIYNVVTITKSSPTSTKWEACATNNLVAEFPYGGYHGRLSPWTNTGSPTSNPDSVAEYPAASDAEDCCAQCQANANCSGSYWSIFGRSCSVYIKKEAFRDTCDPLQEAEVSYLPQDSPAYLISNSGCGQWHFFNWDSPIS